MNTLIIIPHYGSREHLDRLLPSLGVSPLPKGELLDASYVIPATFGQIFIWNNNIYNAGFTKACNYGMRYGVNHNFDIFWLLNNDTVVPNIHEAIKALEDEFQNSPTTGVCGFKILSMDDPDFIHHGGTGQAVPAGVHKVGRVSLGQYTEKTKEKWVTGASMAISAGCLMEVGLMDEKMVNYGSDSDYCYRARYSGFDVVYLPIPIKHKIGQSQNPSEAQITQIRHDMLVFHSKWIIGKAFHELDSELLTVEKPRL
jgi:GT2 family glycosyltransferase